jgi:hypothetical protein
VSLRLDAGVIGFLFWFGIDFDAFLVRASIVVVVVVVVSSKIRYGELRRFFCSMNNL